MRTILQANTINKIYQVAKGNHHLVLKDINIEIKEGEFVSIMGPSGSGKSTLLYSLSGMDKISTGQVIFHSTELQKLKENQLAKVRLNEMGYIFQQNQLLKNLNIIDNIVLPGYLAKQCTRQEVDAWAQELVQLVGIETIQTHAITEVSGGQLQRAAICRALINKPRIIFADEPTGALNSKATNEVMQLLTKINETNTTIVIATHDVKVAMRSERIIFMMDGQIAADKTLGKVIETTNMKDREEEITMWLATLGF